jgi:hypothetical protein
VVMAPLFQLASTCRKTATTLATSFRGSSSPSSSPSLTQFGSRPALHTATVYTQSTSKNMTDKQPELPEKAAFFMALDDLDATLRTNLVNYETTSCTAKHPLLRTRLYASVTKDLDVIPIKLQARYRLFSVAFVGFYQLGLRFPSPHALLGSLAIMVLLVPSHNYSILHVRNVACWYALYNSTASLAPCFSSALNALSTDDHTFRQELLLHWCISFFLISETHWWLHFRQTICHPNKRDL